MPPVYTEITGAIVRGGRWPPAAGFTRVIIIRTQDDVALDWPAGTAGWTWALLLSRSQFGSTPDLTITASVINVSGNVVTLYFTATEAQTNTLPNTNKVRYWAQIRSVTGAGVDSYYGAGRALVESSVGEA